MAENMERPRSKKSILVALAILAAILVGVGGYYWLTSSPSDEARPDGETTQPEREDRQSVVLATIESDVLIEPGSGHDQAIATSHAAYESAPAVLYVASDDESLQTARDIASETRVPVLLAPDSDPGDGEGAADTDSTEEAGTTEESSQLEVSDQAVVDEAERLGADTIITIGTEAPKEWEGEVSDDTDSLAQLDVPEPESPVTVLTDQPASGGLINLVSAGGTIQESTPDPRQSPEVIAALAEGHTVVSVFSTELPDLEWQMNTARTGVELPGGGQLVFGNKRYVALYGSPASASLGVLGEQDVPETIARAQEMADQYQGLTEDTVIPSLEIIATVASGGAGDDGNYSNEWDIETLRPLIEAAQDAGQYVVLDFQPGRSDFLSQVQAYEELLMYPHVGIALDPEWRIGPEEEPLTRIGHVEIDEVNEVATYLADFTRDNNLPQKLVILHQFQVQMIRDIDQLDQSRSEIEFLLHADGQGSQGAKQGTWATLLGYAPNIEYWGWKNFYDEDSPMLTPEETYNVEPLPHFVSYQ